MHDENERSASNLQQDYARYRVFDEHYEEIGRVDDLFVDESGQPEYIGVKMGFLGMKSTLIPMDLVRANDKRELLEVAAPKQAIKNAPSFDDDETVSPEHEAEIRRYYNLSPNTSESPRGGYSSPNLDAERPPNVDLEYGERRGAGEPPETARPDAEVRPPRQDSRQEPLRDEPVRDEPVRDKPVRDKPVRDKPVRDEPVRDKPVRDEPVRDEPVAAEGAGDDELRIQRTEEELRTGTREREAGAVNVRRRTRTDRERVRVPKKREEVTVERVPVGDEPVSESPEQNTPGGSPGVESDEEEIRIPVVEEEVVVEKRPVVKEELRIKKRIVEEEEIVEEDVRKEEVEIEGEANYRDD